MAASQRGEDAGHIWTYIMLRGSEMKTAQSFSFQSSWSSSQLTCSPAHLVGRVHLNDRRASYKHHCDGVIDSFCVQLLQSIIILNDKKQRYFLTLLPSLCAGLVSLGFSTSTSATSASNTAEAFTRSVLIDSNLPNKRSVRGQSQTKLPLPGWVIFEIVISARRLHCIYLIYREKRFAGALNQSCKHIIINQISGLKTH